MSERETLIASFLKTTAWSDAVRAPLAGDASNRRYERLTNPETGATAVLMDAPPEKGEDVRPFVRIARHLIRSGLAAPTIFAENSEQGFLVIEDLGDDLFARVLEKKPHVEIMLYEAAIDVLVALHQVPLPELESYNPALMTEYSALAYSRYRRGILGDADGEDEFRTIFQEICTKHNDATPVLIQRDYHAENLLWLPEREGVERVGLLDFQDAMSGHPAYDLVSLLQDARRDVAPEVEEAMIIRYLEKSGLDNCSYRAAYAVLGVQRNLRILGVFARLGQDHGKPHYVDLIPRVWNHLIRDLDHPALAPVAEKLRAELPEPTPENLERLKQP